MGWLIALAVILLLAILPLGVSAAYNASGTKVALIAGPLRICLFPRGKKNTVHRKLHVFYCCWSTEW